MEVGEPITEPQFLDDDVHNEKTCPWHKDGKKKAKKMDPVDPDDDSKIMPPNDGGKLGRNLTDAKNKRPTVDTVEIKYKAGDLLFFKSGKKTKEVQAYKNSSTNVEYDLQYAPHHLIPGNESLKGNLVVAFLGDTDTISNFANGQTSHIKDGFSAGYDVNDADNGVWLPSPYALSMANRWPSEPGVKVIKRRRGVALGESTEKFKEAYVAASIEATGRQFHMRHKAYSSKVQTLLTSIGERLCMMVTGTCPIAESSDDGSNKFDPPPGLVARLNVMSSNLDRLLTGSRWQPPMFADDMTRQYSLDLKKVKAQAALQQVL
jgi:hypothetical protein